MKNKTTTIIVTVCLTVAFAIAAVLCFVIPAISRSIAKKDCPVQAVDVKVESRYVSGYGRFYWLTGKIKNVSDEEIVIAPYGGIRVYFSGSNGVANDFRDETTEDVHLAPNEAFDLYDNGGYFFESSSVSVSKVIVTVDGVDYYVKGNEGGLVPILGFVFAILAVTMLIVAIATVRQNKTGAVRAETLADICNRLGDDSAVIYGTVTDKTESKKAAAKTAGWVIGGAIGALFTGVGVYRVYSGAVQKQFIINKNSLYLIQEGDMTGENLLKITPDNYAVESVTLKKKTVIMKTADKKQTVKFSTDKKSPLTAERIAEYLNDIFINKVALAPEQAAPTIEAGSSEDPFTDLQPDIAVTDATAATDAQAEEKELSVDDSATSDEDIN